MIISKALSVPNFGKNFPNFFSGRGRQSVPLPLQLLRQCSTSRSPSAAFLRDCKILFYLPKSGERSVGKNLILYPPTQKCGAEGRRKGRDMASCLPPNYAYANRATKVTVLKSCSALNKATEKSWPHTCKIKLFNHAIKFCKSSALCPIFHFIV